MRERPILFRPALVRAILDGHKTQTRRVARGMLPREDFLPDLNEAIIEAHKKNGAPYGAPGDRLWVRERWHHGDFPGAYCYAADKDPHDEERGCTSPAAKWKPSIHMPRAACRLVLEVVSVSFERLQDIDQKDALAEGTWTTVEPYEGEKSPIEHFRESWDRINAERGFGWDANPWVWAITFKRVVA